MSPTLVDRIAGIRAFALEASIEEPVEMSFGTLDQRRSVLIEAESTEGHIGYGESWVNYPGWASDERIATIEKGIAPLVVGQEVESVRSIVHKLRRKLHPLSVQWGGIGPLHQGLSGVEIALFDLLGKSNGRSVASLLGGAVRQEVPVYASAVGPSTPGELARRCVDDGFSAIKCRVGFGRDRDHETLASVREEIGRGFPLYVDANQAWTVPEAVRLIREFREYEVEWFEEPIRGNRLEDLEAVFRLTGVGIATGENNYGLDEFARLAISPAISVMQPDVSKVGGIRETDLIAQLADATGTVLIPHSYGGPISLAATAQLAAVAGYILAIEYDVRQNPLSSLVVDGDLPIRDGVLHVPQGPGLGIQLDQDVIQRYRVPT